VDAQRGWKDFRRPEFENLRDRFGVNWFVLDPAQVLGMDCLYQNSALYVCRIPIENRHQGQ
jgi:hypothetical protein